MERLLQRGYRDRLLLSVQRGPGVAVYDIACWFVDTDYNGESFFVRHAYFTGADEPYDKLKRALRAAIDEAAWASLYSTVSRPFPQPASGKILQGHQPLRRRSAQGVRGVGVRNAVYHRPRTGCSGP